MEQEAVHPQYIGKMIYKKISPIGLDRNIQFIQERIYENLQTVFGIAETTILSYGRVYKIEKGDSYTLRWYKSAEDYEEHDMLLEDKYAVHYFFIEADSRSFISQYETDVDVYFFVNLKTVKPSITHRADEEVKRDIQCILRKFEGFQGLERIKDLPGFEVKMDMQPFHSFKSTIKIRYDYEKTI